MQSTLLISLTQAQHTHTHIAHTHTHTHHTHTDTISFGNTRSISLAHFFHSLGAISLICWMLSVAYSVGAVFCAFTSYAITEWNILVVRCLLRRSDRIVLRKFEFNVNTHTCSGYLWSIHGFVGYNICQTSVCLNRIWSAIPFGAAGDETIFDSCVSHSFVSILWIDTHIYCSMIASVQYFFRLIQSTEYRFCDLFFYRPLVRCCCCSSSFSRQFQSNVYFCLHAPQYFYTQFLEHVRFNLQHNSYQLFHWGSESARVSPKTMHIIFGLLECSVHVTLLIARRLLKARQNRNHMNWNSTCRCPIAGWHLSFESACDVYDVSTSNVMMMMMIWWWLQSIATHSVFFSAFVIRHKLLPSIGSHTRTA